MLVQAAINGPFLNVNRFRDGAINLIHYGGGFNHWFNDRWGMRFEVRNHTQTRSAEYQLLQFRVAFLFR